MIDHTKQWAEAGGDRVAPAVVGQASLNLEEDPRIEVQVREDVDAELDQGFIDDSDLFFDRKVPLDAWCVLRGDTGNVRVVERVIDTVLNAM